MIGRNYAEPVFDDPTEPVELYRRTWQPVDLTDVLEGTWRPLEPTVGRRTDGVGLFYPGKAHTVSSESEAGKTWFVLSAVLDEIGVGNHVLYVDFEDDAGPLVGRLLTLGLSRELIAEHFHYLRPEGPVGTGINLDDLETTLSRYSPTLGILDGITEAMTLHGLNPLDNADAAKFGRMLPRRITEAGTACVSCDHVTKSTENRGRYSIGAVHKLNALDGAAYVLDNRKAFGVGLTGRSTVKIAKDRPGQLRKHALPSSGGLHWFGDLVLTSHAEGFSELEVTPPEESAGADPRPTVLMAKVAWRGVRVLKNGDTTDPIAYAAINADTGGGNSTFVSCFALHRFVAGDLVRVDAYQSSGADLDLSIGASRSNLTLHRVIA